MGWRLNVRHAHIIEIDERQLAHATARNPSTTHDPTPPTPNHTDTVCLAQPLETPPCRRAGPPTSRQQLGQR